MLTNWSSSSTPVNGYGDWMLVPFISHPFLIALETEQYTPRTAEANPFQEYPGEK